MVVAKAWAPVGGPQEGLYRTGQVDKHVAHKEEPGGRGLLSAGGRAEKSQPSLQGWSQASFSFPAGLLGHEGASFGGGGAYMERMGATSSREAIRMPISQMQAVSRRAQVGSPFALPWPKTCGESAERGAGQQFPGAPGGVWPCIGTL